MAYIQTTKRLIHVKEGLTKLKNRLFQSHYSEQQRLENIDFITVTEIIPEIDIQLKRDQYFGIRCHAFNIKIEKIESDWSKIEEGLLRQNESLSKGKKIFIRVSDIMELHDEKR